METASPNTALASWEKLRNRQVPVPDLKEKRHELDLEGDELSVAARNYYQRIFKTAPCASVILDPTGNLIEFNDEFAEFAGLKRPPLGRTSFSIYIGRNSLADFLEHLRDCRSSKYTRSTAVSMRSAQNASVPVRLFTRFYSSRQTKVFRIIIIDDAEHAHAMRKAAHDLVACQDFIDSIDGIVWEMDTETGRTTYLSKQAERLLGHNSQEWMRGADFRQRYLYVDDRERVLNEMARAVAQRRSYVTEYRMITADRSLVWLRDSVVVREVDGRLKLRGVAIDITDRKIAEAKAARASEELEEKVKQRTAQMQWTVSELESFSYTLSHDMRAPLRAISSYADYLAQSLTGQTGETRNYLERIMAGARRLDGLIQDVLKYSGLANTPAEIKQVDLNVLIRSLADESADLVASRANMRIAGKLHPVMGHEGFIAQCVSNLISNAIKFAKPGIKPRVRIWTDEDEHFVRLWVADNGIGIAPEDHLRIFKVFERCHDAKKVEGTGIGLAIVQRAAERMNGSVGVESFPGKGSKFWIKLRRPAAQR